jgi:hypothetical protein
MTILGAESLKPKTETSLIRTGNATAFKPTTLREQRPGKI